MRKLTYILLIIVSVFIITKIVINKYYYGDNFLLPSKNYEDALNSNVVVAEYRIKEMDNKVLDSLEKYNYYQKVVDNKYWIEKLSREVPKYLFFSERIMSRENYIRYDDLITSTCEGWRKWLTDSAKIPMIILSPEDSTSINEIRREEHYSRTLYSELLPYQVTLYVFLKRPKNNSHQSVIHNISDVANPYLVTEYLGKIVLVELEDSSDNIRIASSIWKSFNLIPESVTKHPCYLGDIVKDEKGRVIRK